MKSPGPTLRQTGALVQGFSERAKRDRTESPKVQRIRPLLAEGKKTVAAIPVITVTVQVEPTPRVALVQTGHAPLAIKLDNGTRGNDRKITLDFREAFPKGKQFRDRGGAKAALFQLGFDRLSTHIPSEVDELGDQFLFAFSLDRKPLCSDVVVSQS